MKILALDVSFTSTGIAGSDGLLETRKLKGRGVKRLSDAGWMFLELASRYDVVVIEGYSYGSQGRAIVSIGELGGVLRVELYRAEIPVLEVPPSTLKKYATGKGNAPKDAVLAAAIRRLEYGGHSSDEADALWLLEIGRAILGETHVTVPKTHRRALEKLAVPKGVIVCS